jgi:acyl-CoA synthetase (NDP forming)
MSGGFGGLGPAGLHAERALTSLTRANGMRLIGPECLGIMNTAPEVRLNATLAPTLSRRGRAGFFAQSGALGVTVLEPINRRGLGLSTFVSAGDQADVSGNDLLQYWQDDPATEVILLHIESFGNPRKFVRLARRLGRDKPIVAVKSGGAVAARLRQVADPERTADALFRQAGVIRVDTLAELADVAQVLTSQPLPAGRRVAVVGNSKALGTLAVDACIGHGLRVGPLSAGASGLLRTALGPDADVGNPLVLPPGSSAADLGTALRAVLGDDSVDAVVTVFVPPLGRPDASLDDVQAQVSKGGTKPLVATVLSFDGQRPGDNGVPSPGVPSFPSPEVAVTALARVVGYAEWRRRPQGLVPIIDGVRPDLARSVVTDALRRWPAGTGLTADQTGRLLAGYGVRLWPAIPVTSREEAAAAAATLGYPVALKATAPPLRHRPERGTVRLDISGEQELGTAYQAMTARLGDDAGLAVQAMAPPGVATVIRTADDPSFGALISFGVAGVATDLLGDHALRILPLTDRDATELVRSVRAAPLLFGYRGSEPVDVAALEQLLLRVARLADDLPEVAELELNPVIVTRGGASVLGATARVAAPPVRLDTGPRRMR